MEKLNFIASYLHLIDIENKNFAENHTHNFFPGTRSVKVRRI